MSKFFDPYETFNNISDFITNVLNDPDKTRQITRDDVELLSLRVLTKLNLSEPENDLDKKLNIIVNGENRDRRYSNFR